MTHRRLAALGIAEGWRCLEVGGGLGSIARWLARGAGASGHVTVTDLDTRFLQEVKQSNIEVWKHDVLADTLPEAQFDLIHVRWVLYHLQRPEEACARLVKALRPGGRILIEDVDFFPLRAASSPEYVRYQTALGEAVGAAVGHDGYWAVNALPRMLRNQRVEAFDLTVDVDTLRGATPMAEFWRITGEQVRARVEATKMDAAAFEAAMRQLRDPAFWSLSCAHVAVSGRRPRS
jgi:SAM-dependent methyltransferase